MWVSKCTALHGSLGCWGCVEVNICNVCAYTVWMIQECRVTSIREEKYCRLMIKLHVYVSKLLRLH